MLPTLVRLWVPLLKPRGYQGVGGALSAKNKLQCSLDYRLTNQWNDSGGESVMADYPTLLKLRLA